MFRPLNSSESNLFTIRATIGNILNNPSPYFQGGVQYTIASYNGIAQPTPSVTNIYQNYLISPSNNNLPSGFYINLLAAGSGGDSASCTYIVYYGKTFTSQPNIYITPNTIGGTAPTSYYNVVPNIIIKDSAYTYATFTFNGIHLMSSAVYTQNALPGYQYTGFDILITGSVKTGVNTGNSNKGWALNDTTNADPVGTYSSLDVSLGSAIINTNSISICKTLKLLNTSNTVTTFTGTQIDTSTSYSYTIQPSDYYTSVWLLNQAGGLTMSTLTPSSSTIGMVLVITNIATIGSGSMANSTVQCTTNSLLLPATAPNGTVTYPPTAPPSGVGSTTKTKIFLSPGSSVTLFGTSQINTVYYFNVISSYGSIGFGNL